LPLLQHVNRQCEKLANAGLRKQLGKSESFCVKANNLTTPGKGHGALCWLSAVINELRQSGDDDPGAATVQT